MARLGRLGRGEDEFNVRANGADVRGDHFRDVGKLFEDSKDWLYAKTNPLFYNFFAQLEATCAQPSPGIMYVWLRRFVEKDPAQVLCIYVRIVATLCRKRPSPGIMYLCTYSCEVLSKKNRCCIQFDSSPGRPHSVRLFSRSAARPGAGAAIPTCA